MPTRSAPRASTVPGPRVTSPARAWISRRLSTGAADPVAGTVAAVPLLPRLTRRAVIAASLLSSVDASQSSSGASRLNSFRSGEPSTLPAVTPNTP